MSAQTSNEPTPIRPSLSLEAREWLRARGLDAVLCEELGLTSGRLRQDGPEWIKIPYEKNGQLVNYKLRSIGSKEWSQKKDGEQVLWRLECLTDAALDNEPLVITEGEFDAIAAVQAGYWRTVSVPGGAQSGAGVVADALEVIERVREIVIAADDDGPGHELLEELVGILGPARCRKVAYPKGCKDLNDVLRRFGEEGVKKCVEASPWANVAGVFLLDDLPELPDLTIWRPSIEGLRQVLPICPGHVSVWTGIAGHGKSTLLNACAWSIADTEKLRIGHGAFETTPQREYLQDLIAHKTGYAVGDRQMPAGAVESVRQWARDHIVFINSDGASPATSSLIDASLDWFLQCAQTAVIRHGARFIILDPWSQIDHDMDAREREDQYIRRSLRRFRAFARTFNVHLAIVAHPMKPKRDACGGYEMPEGYEISGAAHWYNFADLGVTVHKDPERDANGEPRPDSNRVRIRVWKVKNHRMMGKPQDANMSLDYVTGRYSRWSQEPQRSAAVRKDIYD